MEGKGKSLTRRKPADNELEKSKSHIPPKSKKNLRSPSPHKRRKKWILMKSFPSTCHLPND